MKNLFSVLLFVILIPTETKGQEFSKVNFDKTTYNVVHDHKVEVERSISLTIIDEKAYRNAIVFEYYDKFKSIKTVEATIKDNQGKRLKKIPFSACYDYAFSNSYEVNDTRFKILDPDFRLFPFTIEILIKYELNGFINLPDWNPIMSGNLINENGELTIKYPDNLPITYVTQNIIKIDSSSSNGSNEIKFYSKENDKIRLEDSNEEGKSNASRVLVSTKTFNLSGYPGSMESWQEFGNWFNRLNSGLNDLSTETKRFLTQLNFDIDSRVEKMGIIYEYMQNKTRYVSIQLGIGGFQSLPASLVETKGYGDCKALSNYLKSMLDFAGIPSNFVLIKAGNENEPIYPDHIGNQFNHVIVGVPNGSDTVYFECTSTDFPMGYLGSFTDNRYGLWIDGDNSQLIKTPSYSENQNKILTTSTILINELGQAEIKMNRKSFGVFFEEYFKMIANDQKSNLDFKFADFALKDITLNDIYYTEPNMSSLSYKYSLGGTGRNLIQKAGNNLVLPSYYFNTYEDKIIHNKHTAYAKVPRGFTSIDTVELLLPNSYFIYQVPDNQILETSLYNYKRTIHKDQNKITIISELKLKAGEFKDSEYPQFYEFIESIKKINQKKIILKPTT